MPGPAPQHRESTFEPASENRACEGCHADIAEEWRGSLHQRSWDDRVFLTAYAIEPQSFCRGCHAPESDPSETPGEASRRMGVACVTCHEREGEALATHPADAAHDIAVERAFATESACNGCHDFAFPTPQSAPMQGTGVEHTRSAKAQVTCSECHMPEVESGGRKHKRHDFRVQGNPELLKGALQATASRGSDRAITVTLAAPLAGHAFPTGDMFRRLEIRAKTTDESAKAEPVVLARRFAMMSGPTGLEHVQIGDDRLQGTREPALETLTFAEPLGTRDVAWEVAYQRMAPGMAALFGVDESADEVIVASGVVRGH